MCSIASEGLCGGGKPLGRSLACRTRWPVVASSWAGRWQIKSLAKSRKRGSSDATSSPPTRRWGSSWAHRWVASSNTTSPISTSSASAALKMCKPNTPPPIRAMSREDWNLRISPATSPTNPCREKKPSLATEESGCSKNRAEPPTRFLKRASPIPPPPRLRTSAGCCSPVISSPIRVEQRVPPATEAMGHPSLAALV